ncbi:TPA: hypothetical protein DEA17_02170, partial [Candidatus Nomurabacteria bacterium]|nr:hypothetical protein [Candidatus Nomurabacteria bacterium]
MLNPKLQIKIKNFYKSKKNFFILFLILFFLLSPFSTSHAAINKQINYQGKLTNASGVAVADGIYNMEFVLYDVSTGGVALWTETRTTTNRVQVTSGLFSVLLGEVTALTSVDFNQTLYLGVNIGGVDLTPVWDGEMTPRKKLGSVPSAVVAENAINIIGGSAGYVPFQTAANTTSFSSNFFWDNSNARLGIGTTSPLQQLQVGTGAGQHVVTIGDARIAIGTNSSSESRIQTGSGKNLTFAVNSDTWNLGTTAMTILTTGNVGIGTTGPAQKLTLIGDARFENNNRNYFKVTTSNGANVVNIGDD